MGIQHLLAGTHRCLVECLIPLGLYYILFINKLLTISKKFFKHWVIWKQECLSYVDLHVD